MSTVVGAIVQHCSFVVVDCHRMNSSWTAVPDKRLEFVVVAVVVREWRER